MAVSVNRQRDRLSQHPRNSLGCLCIVEGSKRSLILNGATWKTVDDAGWWAFCVEGDLPCSQGPGVHHGPRQARPAAGGSRGGGRVGIFIAPVRAKARKGRIPHVLANYTLLQWTSTPAKGNSEALEKYVHSRLSLLSWRAEASCFSPPPLTVRGRTRGQNNPEKEMNCN